MEYLLDYHPPVRGVDQSKMLTLPSIECRAVLGPGKWSKATWQMDKLYVVAYWRNMHGRWTSDWVEVDTIDPLFAAVSRLLLQPDHVREINRRWPAYVRVIDEGDLYDAIERRQEDTV